MGMIRMGCPEEFILRLKKVHPLEEFIETGTYKGGTSKWASQYFNTVRTIENSKIIYNETSKQLSKVDNIECLYGNSKDQLKNVTDQNKLQLFWLDAHWCGGDTYGSEDECPLMEELTTIVEHANVNSIILIDDARLFMAPPPSPHQAKEWPSLSEIFNQFDNNYYITIFDDTIFLGAKKFQHQFITIIQDYITHQVSSIEKEKLSLIDKLKKITILIFKDNV